MEVEASSVSAVWWCQGFRVTVVGGSFVGGDDGGSSDCVGGIVGEVLSVDKGE